MIRNLISVITACTTLLLIVPVKAEGEIPGGQTPTIIDVNQQFEGQLPTICIRNLDNELEELRSYADNISTRIRSNKRYRSNKAIIDKLGESEIQKYADIARDFMEVENNIDYTSTDDSFIEKYRYFFMPGSGQEWQADGIDYNSEQYVQLRLNDIKEYEIAIKSIFLTDKTLVYASRDGDRRVRGRLIFIYTSVNNDYFEKYSLPVCELNKWYYEDVEVSLGDYFSNDLDKWEHAKHTFNKKTVISDIEVIWGLEE